MTKKVKKPADILEDMFEKRRQNSKVSPYKKLRKDIRCKCKRHKSLEKQRIKYGTCACDAFSMNYTLAIVISNYLYQYLTEAKGFIIREDWDILEGCAKSIREYSEADSWDAASDKRGVKTAYLKKERAFKKSMKYLVDNWQSLWF